MRVGIVEDDSLLRTTLTDLLDAQVFLTVVSSASSSETILEQAADGNLDVALLDVHLGEGPTGFDIATRLRHIRPLVGIVFLSSVRDPRLLGFQPSTLPTGARYLLKSDVSNIEWLVEELCTAATDSYDPHADPLPSIPFSQAQIDILRLVAEGHSNAAIAQKRSVTEGAVEMAIFRLAKHLGLNETPGTNRRVHIAAKFFREMGWTI